jgi:2-polyprenyl-6-methoxyphenol hydroxylase-like FAD-dependent oxidoreductase
MEAVMLPTSTDVLIVGAGPTGLALAAMLQQEGVDHVVIDPLTERHALSRAGVVHAHTLETLARIDVTDRLRARGMPVRRFAVRDRDRVLLSVGFEDLPSPHNYVLMIPQFETEAILEARLTELGGRVRRGYRAAAAERTAAGARVTVEGPEGAQAIVARHVVGADGMHSLVREAAGIAFPGATYGESFVLADVELDPSLDPGEVSLNFARDGLAVIAPLPDGSVRVVATMADAPEHPSIADVQRLLDTRGRPGSATVARLRWSSRFRVHHRLADHYRDGPFLLMGDAAHVHSPAGGQGMNAGLVDAIVLGEALARVVRDGEPEALLDDYARLRRPAAQAVLALSGRLTRIATAHGPLRLLRNLALRTLDRSPSFKRKLALDLSGLSRRNLAALPAPARVQGEAGGRGTATRLVA